MKPKILVNFLFSAVIFYTAVISEGIFHGNNKKTSRSFSRLNTSGRKDDNLKDNEVISTRRTSGKLRIAGRVSR